jgi:alpha-ribazole phosphatase/probable phosphoglycerate mutase
MQMRRRRIILLRHGRTDWNDQFRYQGTSDVPLNAEGETQARRAGERLAPIPLDRILVSGMARAGRTAELVVSARAEPVPLETVPELGEMNFGIFEGRTVMELEAEQGDLLRRWRASPLDVVLPEGESYRDMALRIEAAADRVDAAPGATILVVGHGFAFRPLLARLMKVESSEGILSRIRLDNVSLSAVDYWGTDPYLSFLNDAQHLRVPRKWIPRLGLPD